MKKLIIAVSLLSLVACTKKTSSSPSGTGSGDTTFNGSYFQIAYNGKSFYCKDAAVGSTHLVILTSSEQTVPTDTGSGGSVNSIAIGVNSAIGGGLYGLTSVVFYGYDQSASTGSFNFGTIHVNGTGSTLIQSNPTTIFSDTSGTINVTYSGSDYIQGTFTTTLNASGISYPATGSFKIYH